MKTRIVHVISGLLTGGAEWMMHKLLRQLSGASFANLIVNTAFTGADTTKYGVLINDFGALRLKIATLPPTSLTWAGTINN